MLQEDPFLELLSSNLGLAFPCRWPNVLCNLGTCLKPVSKTALRRREIAMLEIQLIQWPVSSSKPDHRSRHPMLPYLTEELYQRLPPSPTKCESITVAPFPMGVHAWRNEALEKEMEANTEKWWKWMIAGLWWRSIFQTEFPELLVWDTFWLFRHNMTKYHVYTYTDA